MPCVEKSRLSITTFIPREIQSAWEERENSKGLNAQKQLDNSTTQSKPQLKESDL